MILSGDFPEPALQEIIIHTDLSRACPGEGDLLAASRTALDLVESPDEEEPAVHPAGGVAIGIHGSFPSPKASLFNARAFSWACSLLIF
jgi:hypothetical protein